MKFQIFGSVAAFLFMPVAHAQVSESADIMLTIQKESSGPAISLTKFQDMRFSQHELIDGNTSYTSPINTFCVYSETPTFTVEVNTANNRKLVDSTELADPDAIKIHYTMGLSEIAEDGSVIQFLDSIYPGHAPEVIDISKSMRGENCDTGNNIGLDLGIRKVNFDAALEKLEPGRDYEFVDTITLTIAPNL
ncbi:hypothetical protein [Hirschia maritima]|uniref:hypothetical protein n=1 Tax=Hirschia maritima TaxID=1121961 RepID=UPI000375605A|nr:hypothetical protein [Hirschia maritima]